MARFTTVLPTLAPLPADCTFTLAIELRDAADAPIGVSLGNVQPWIVAQPGMQREQTDRRKQKDQSKQPAPEEPPASISPASSPTARETGLRSVRTTPIRSLEAGAFVMEVWVEEGKGKVGLQR